MLVKSLLKAKYFGAREFKAHLSAYLKMKDPQILTVYGEPKKVVLEYDDLMDLIDWFEEFQDKALMAEIAEARKKYDKHPGKAISAESFFKQW